MATLSTDAYTILFAALRDCLAEIVDNKDFESARYVLTMIEVLSKDVAQ